MNKHHTALLVLMTSLSLNLQAASDESLDSFLELDLEDLLSIEVTSVSKKKQRLNEAAAAIYVITNEDIQRSGVTSIADALRLAPGIQVARIDSNKWAVSSRGFNAQFANKLLVLMDGRSVYTPSYSGVYWADQDTVLEDIDRIEVIRGPGATLWGANAVNGVINIITKSAAETKGSLFVVGAGDEEKNFAHYRNGFALGDDLDGRFYFKLKQVDSSYASELEDDNNDDWQSLRGGFRIDTDADAHSSWTLQGDIYENDQNQIVKSDWLDPFDPANASFEDDGFRAFNVDDQAVSRGYNLLARWQHQHDDSIVTLQGYFDHTYRNERILQQDIDTVDLEFQHQYSGFDGHDIVWGLGYRQIKDQFDNTFSVAVENPDAQTSELLSAFIQDEIELDDNLRLTLGSKFEDNEYTGTEVQPNVRLLWLPKPGHTLWSSVSRAVRTPSVVERRGRLATGYIPFGLERTVYVNGGDDFDSENLDALEVGYRWQLNEQSSIDVAVFYNQYSDVNSFEITSSINIPGFDPIPNNFDFSNKRDVTTQGLELVYDWLPRENWKLQATYSYLSVSDDLDEDSTDVISTDVIEGSSPQNHLSIRSSYDFSANLSLDLWVYYVDELEASAFSANDPTVDDYTSLNLKLDWRPQKHMTVSLVGQNLTEDRHTEFLGEGFISEAELERSAYLQVKLDF